MAIFLCINMYSILHLYTDAICMHLHIVFPRYTTTSQCVCVLSLPFILSNTIKQSSNAIWKIWYNYILIFRSHYVVIKSRKLYFDSILLCMILYVHFIWYSSWICTLAQQQSLLSSTLLYRSVNSGTADNSAMHNTEEINANNKHKRWQYKIN